MVKFGYIDAAIVSTTETEITAATKMLMKIVIANAKVLSGRKL